MLLRSNLVNPKLQFVNKIAVLPIPMVLTMLLASPLVIGSSEQNFSFILDIAKVDLIDDEDGIPTKSYLTGNNYRIQSEVFNASEREIEFAYLALITNTEGITQEIMWDTYKIKPKEIMTIGFRQTVWNPALEGDYRISVFMWSNMDRPIPLSKIGGVDLFVSKNMVRLVVGEGYQGLVVKAINKDDKTVIVDVTNCWGPACSMGSVKDKSLLIGDSVAFKCSADALLLNIEDHIAVFEIKKAHEYQCLLV